MHMYTDTYGRYPYYVTVNSMGEYRYRYPYYYWHTALSGLPVSFSFTNQLYRCPAFKAHVVVATGDPWKWSTYAYNTSGTDSIGGGLPGSANFLGLGNSSPYNGGTVPAISESKVLRPSEMYAIADGRELGSNDAIRKTFDSELDGIMRYGNAFVDKPWHGKGYNVLFCDGHVVFVKRLDFIDVRKTARNWNNDYQPHEDTWRGPMP